MPTKKGLLRKYLSSTRHAWPGPLYERAGKRVKFVHVWEVGARVTHLGMALAPPRWEQGRN